MVAGRGRPGPAGFPVPLSLRDLDLALPRHDTTAAGPAWRLPLGMVVVMVESVRLRPRLLQGGLAWPGRNLRRQWSGVRSV
jgi:hypothetical protein